MKIMKKINLSIIDRLILPQLLPQQGGKIEMLLANSLTKMIDFSPEEISEYGLKDQNGYVTWSNGKEVDYEFTPEQVDLLKSVSKRADEEGKITQQNLPLIEKIDNL